MKTKLILLACALASTAPAQLSNYLGPGILTRGAGSIGDRAGQQVDFRFFVDASGLYDNNIQPFSVDSKGNLVRVTGLYGVQASFGAYGSHRFRKANLGLDYKGNFYHYSNGSYYDGSTQNLTLGYTYQPNKRLVLDLRQLAGTTSNGVGGLGNYGNFTVASNFVDPSTSVLFDDRTYYLQSSMDANFLLTPRTVITMGGDGATVQRHSRALANVHGYGLHGAIMHRVSRNVTLQVAYEHSHYDFAPSFGESNINTVQAGFATSLGRRWTFNLAAGVYQAQVQGLRSVAVDPVIAALLGQTTTVERFAATLYSPSGTANLTGRFKTSSVTLNYNRSVSPGNGVYFTSRSDAANLSYSYTGIRKWNLGGNISYGSLNSIGQGLSQYYQVSGGGGLTYALTGPIHLTARYDVRRQEIDLAGYRQTGSRAAVGISFSPGNLPLSLW